MLTKTLASSLKLPVVLAFVCAALLASNVYGQFRGPTPASLGAVYVMTNDDTNNEIAVFLRGRSGALSFFGNVATGGAGSTEFDGGEGLDPLISADSLITSLNQEFLFAVNAGSDSISSFRILGNFQLELVSTVPSGGVGPNSLAINDGRLFVSNIDRDGFALGDPQVPRGEPNDEGNLVGFNVDDDGVLTPIAGSTIELDNRPADISFSTNGDYLIVTSITAGSAALPGPNAANSVAVYEIDEDGISLGMTGSQTGTQVGNAEGRNLASAIDFDIANVGGREFIVVTEAREFNSAGGPPALPALQAGSVSVYELEADGLLTDIANDISLGDAEAGPFDPSVSLTACWIDFGSDGRTFYVSNAINASISSFFLEEDGFPTLLDAQAAEGISGFENGATTGPEVFGTTDGFIDVDASRDGLYLYQLAGLDGSIYVYDINGDGSLTQIQQIEGFLPEADTQGLVSVVPRRELPRFLFFGAVRNLIRTGTPFGGTGFPLQR